MRMGEKSLHDLGDENFNIKRENRKYYIIINQREMLFLPTIYLWLFFESFDLNLFKTLHYVKFVF